MTSNRVFVGRLKEFITADDLAHFFRRCGRVREVFRKVDYAFVEFEDVQGAELAIRELHNTLLCGWTVTVRPAIFKREANPVVNSRTKAASPEAPKIRWSRDSAKPQQESLSSSQSSSIMSISPIRDGSSGSSMFGRKSPAKKKVKTQNSSAKTCEVNKQKKDTTSIIGDTIPIIKLEVPEKPPTPLKEQILSDDNTSLKSTEEAEESGLSELVKRPKISLQKKPIATRDTLRVTITDTTTNKYVVPDCFSDCKLVVDGEILHANKSLLSIYSAKLHSMFDATDSNEIIMDDDVSVDEMVVILDFIYPSDKQVSAYNLDCLLKMANKLQIPSVTSRCESYLKDSGLCSLSLTKKLFLAQLYDLESFQTNCINQCDSIEKLKLLKTEDDYELLDGKTMRLLVENATANL